MTRSKGLLGGAEGKPDASQINGLAKPHRFHPTIRPTSGVFVRHRPSRQEWPPLLSQEIADAIAEREGRSKWQGWPLKVVLAASLLLTAGACTDANTSPGVKGDDGIRRRIWTDPATGCQYHFWESGSAQYYAMALSPRIAPDRLPVCDTGRG